jgi:hypothetical protein
MLFYTTPKTLKIDMREYVKKMIEEFPEELKEATCP